MPTIEKLKTFFGQREMPVELVKLCNLQETVGQKFLSDGFGLRQCDTTGISTWSTDPEFLDHLIEFAQANGSGSTYAFWLKDPKASLSQQPVVVFGDEGGVHVVAENILQLLQLLSYDSEPMIDFDKLFFTDNGNHEPSEALDQYIDWLKDNFKLDPIDNPDEIVKAAQRKLQKPFKKWLGRFVEGEGDDDDE
jgi:hypothetical protein